MTTSKLCKAILYWYFPRFMSFTILVRHGENIDLTDMQKPLGPDDYFVRVRFFNFFGRPVFCRYTRLR